MKKILLLLLLPLAASAMDARPIFYSLLVPGLGEYSLGYRGRAAAHVGLEIGSWLGYAHFRSEGFRIREDYESYADEHWHAGRWASAWNEEQPDWLEGMSADDYAANAWEETWESALVFEEEHPGYLQSHYAPHAEDAQHYYENLGKYDWYRWGWDDYDSYTDETYWNHPDSHRTRYSEMRNRSDDNFDRAHQFMVAMMLGRFVSVVDTYLLVARLERGDSFREARDQWRLDFRPQTPGAWRLGVSRSW
ncbi:MAG: hypothetical protein QF492_07580 [Candidatus Krumholzibacteria bacterium]|jgi:hypothetical protein|nr:hypothetical protein [Candidatus Krumholzibacteria bacterium]MDP6669748.1 hypothetical protein [Candidatus Krumholzibacteria bacterium]MDP6796681.1 hypothetical protein [Candidatus Krumholzibacteria bacterium]MDP7020738.1 hypothetical protein [Candidatus Krumholzibacteria bacterium]